MSPHEDERPDLTLLREELHQLERRVNALEHGIPALNAEQTALTAPAPPDFALPNAIPALGKAVLGLAGAYLLRALAETGPQPSGLVVAAAIVYAAAWLLFALRAGKTNALEGATFSLTSVLILSPLLWEATVRFHVLPHLATAAVLVVFTGLSGAAPLVTGASLITALVLMVATGDFAPFALALLAMAALTQLRGVMRIPAVFAAASAVALIAYITTRPGGVPEQYRQISPFVSIMICASLFLVTSAGIAWRTAVRRRTITIFEIAEAVLTFALASTATLQITQGSGEAALGSLCALACAACYFTAFLRFPDSGRNHHVYAAWGAALGLFACFLILPDPLLTPIQCAAAVVATLTRKNTLAIHGAGFLLAAGLTSGLTASIFNAFAGARLEQVTSPLWIFAITAICCYAASSRTRLSVIFAVLAAVSLASLLILVVAPSAVILPTARTLVIAALALAFGLNASRMGHTEFLWVAYALVALGSLKLLMIDFHQSGPATLALSLLCYGGLLVLMPRLRR